MQIYVDPFPISISEPIDVPDMADLLQMPMFRQISVEDFRKHACNFQRHLLDQSLMMEAIKDNRQRYKYVHIDAYVQCLFPGVYATNVAKKPGFWYLQGRLKMDAPGSSHYEILQTSSDANKSFSVDGMLVTSLEKDNISTAKFNKLIASNPEMLPGIKSKKIPANRFVSYHDSHLQKDGEVTEHEFMYTFRITASEVIPPLTVEEARISDSFVYYYDGEQEHVLPSVQQRRDGQIIHFRLPESLRKGTEEDAV